MKKLTLIGITLTLLLGLVLSDVELTTRAAAADFIVTSNDEAELRLAIDKAEVLYVLSGGTAASTITFAPNVTGTITLTMGELVIKSNLTIIGPGANLLTINGNNASRVFYITPVTTSIPQNNTVTLEGLTVAGGNGGGATNTGNGGGIYNESTLTITNCIVSGNSVAGFSGSGGGIFNTPSGTLTITGSAVSGNSAVNAGGILNSGPLTITNSAVSNNSVTGNGGGIGSAGAIGSLTVTNSIVSGNSAGGTGGGFIFNGAATLRLINSTVSGNSAGADGGGVAGQGYVDATNSTVTGNRADSDGNAFGVGGGFHSAGRKLNNTIVAGNFRGAGSTPDDIYGTISTANNSLIGDAATSGGIANGVNGNKVGFAVSAVLNTTLANNGGPTLTHSLKSNSPAIDAGSNALALDASSNPLTTDQRGAGFPRTLDGNGDSTAVVDIGAFENPPCAQTSAPVFANCTDDSVTYLGCNPAIIPGADPGVTASDNCGAVTVLNSITDEQNARVITYTASNSVGVATCTQIYTWSTAAPTIDTQPVAQTACVGASRSFSVVSNVPFPQYNYGLTYQWRKGGMPLTNGGNISGATSPTLTINSISLANAGSYDVVVSNGCGSTPSNAAALTVTPTVTCPANSSVSVSAAPFSLTGGSPAGGSYSGPGVSSGIFNPAAAGVGTHTIQYSYTDVNGCSNSCSFQITVTGASGFNFTGFFQPVDNPPTINTVTAGQAIPVKFSLGGYQGLNIFAAGYPASQPIACSSSSPTDTIEETVTAGGSSLSYDATTDQYKYVWKMDKAWKGKCRKLVLKFSDGSERYALFKFR